MIEILDVFLITGALRPEYYIPKSDEKMSDNSWEIMDGDELPLKVGQQVKVFHKHEFELFDTVFCQMDDGKYIFLPLTSIDLWTSKPFDKWSEVSTEILIKGGEMLGWKDMSSSLKERLVTYHCLKMMMHLQAVDHNEDINNDAKIIVAKYFGKMSIKERHCLDRCSADDKEVCALLEMAVKGMISSVAPNSTVEIKPVSTNSHIVELSMTFVYL